MAVEPNNTEQRTQHALLTLQEHQTYCNRLEREYLHKHEEVKMYVDFNRNSLLLRTIAQKRLRLI